MNIAIIPIVGSIFDFIVNNFLTIVGGTGTVLLAVIGWVTKKYLVPYLKVESRRKYAKYIALIADEITDELRAKYPNQSWAKYIDEAVDKIIKICGIDTEIARRAVMAAINRK